MSIPSEVKMMLALALAKIRQVSQAGRSQPMRTFNQPLHWNRTVTPFRFARCWERRLSLSHNGKP
jgi:hypothetical protein